MTQEHEKAFRGGGITFLDCDDNVIDVDIFQNSSNHPLYTQFTVRHLDLSTAVKEKKNTLLNLAFRLS